MSSAHQAQNTVKNATSIWIRHQTSPCSESAFRYFSSEGWASSHQRICDWQAVNQMSCKQKLTSAAIPSISNMFGRREAAFWGSSEWAEVSYDLLIPGSFSHLGIFPWAFLNTCGAPWVLAASGCSTVFLSLPTSGSDRDGATDAKVDEAEETNDLDKHWRKEISE